MQKKLFHCKIKAYFSTLMVHFPYFMFKPENPEDTALVQLFQSLRYVVIAVLVTAVVATLLTLWTPQALLNETASQAQQPALATVTPSANSTQPSNASGIRIGIVAGHKGNDSGAVCPDGLQEVAVNTDIATRVQTALIANGYTVDVLDEFDSRLQEYRANALVSIHADSCQYINEFATGFKVAGSSESRIPEESTRLASCLTDRYQTRTGMPFHANTVTYDMTQYHAYREISGETPAAIIEVGFLNLDREILTTQADLLAQGIVEGILCYVRREAIKQ
jgi:N-acetylmuramoyl-L-alanine amidase